MTSVVMVCHKRFEKLEEIIQAWLDQEDVDELILLDNSGTFKTRLPITVISSSENLGPQGKYPLAMLCKNERVVFADDDIMPLPGFVVDLLDVWKEDRIVSALGRVFDGENYYMPEGSTGYWGSDIDKPQKVDWVGGGFAMTHQQWCCVPVRKCPHMTIDDMWWQHYLPDLISLWVAPTKNYKMLEEGFDDEALHTHPEIKHYREKYYQEWHKKEK